MKFTPGQVQDALQLSQPTLRHWKTKLPPLKGRSGYTPCFTPGDLLALAVVKSLTEDAGVAVGNLQSVANDLFACCGQGSWVGLERSILLIEPSLARVTTIQEGSAPPLVSGVTVLIALRPLVRLLQERLLPGHQEDQENPPLRFPPTPIAFAGGRKGTP